MTTVLDVSIELSKYIKKHGLCSLCRNKCSHLEKMVYSCDDFRIVRMFRKNPQWKQWTEDHEKIKKVEVM